MKAETRPSDHPKYKYRTVWKFVRKIDYSESIYIFKNIENPNIGLKIETDAQFAKWLVDNFGYGRYHLLVWKKGIEGWTFYNFNCEDGEGFFQVKKRKKYKEREKEKLLREYKRKAKELNESDDEEKKEELKDEMEVIEEIIDIEDEDIDGNKRQKKIRLFKNLQPLYRKHQYQEYGGDSSITKNVKGDYKLI